MELPCAASVWRPVAEHVAWQTMVKHLPILGMDKAWLWAQARHSESKKGISEQLVSMRVVDDKSWASHAFPCLLP